ncbi:MAG: hypothetical protein IKR04_05540 [Clostridia bacterium]|nr:hypothetical protein [Clostridia bacterium]
MVKRLKEWVSNLNINIPALLIVISLGLVGLFLVVGLGFWLFQLVVDQVLPAIK